MSVDFPALNSPTTTTRKSSSNCLIESFSRPSSIISGVVLRRKSWSSSSALRSASIMHCACSPRVTESAHGRASSCRLGSSELVSVSIVGSASYESLHTETTSLNVLLANEFRSSQARAIPSAPASSSSVGVVAVSPSARGNTGILICFVILATTSPGLALESLLSRMTRSAPSLAARTAESSLDTRRATTWEVLPVAVEPDREARATAVGRPDSAKSAPSAPEAEAMSVLSLMSRVARPRNAVFNARDSWYSAPASSPSRTNTVQPAATACETSDSSY
mmetsp:Transcript_5522/g.20133  ORF Transcript_5522/g.20133 Transcript_5522/m.20133 type:complete len:279 (+) Transcript_5522:3210-4046(+)